MSCPRGQRGTPGPRREHVRDKHIFNTLGAQEEQHTGTGIEAMTDFTLRQLQKKLEKEKTETEWKLKEYGWRLDQASAVSLHSVAYQEETDLFSL